MFEATWTISLGGADLIFRTRIEFFHNLQTLRPVAATSHTPVYSNMAFQVLAYALEGMTNRTFSESLRSSLLEPLGLTRTFLDTPHGVANAVIPDDVVQSGWNISLGDASP
jgi:CubicO group peptidase (beta-lactamase class C family)